jgi:hypothetical protein
MSETEVVDDDGFWSRHNRYYLDDRGRCKGDEDVTGLHGGRKKAEKIAMAGDGREM